MKALFNSLGSNYSKEYIALVKRLFFKSATDDTASDLSRALNSYFPVGRLAFYYKGRDAIAVALMTIPASDNKKIFIQGFACYAIEEAVQRAGYQACYVDVAENSLNMSVETLELAAKKYGYPKVALVQHTLGYLAEMKSISEWCLKHDIILIEDIAQAFGAKAKDENYNQYADLVVGSFGRDKIIDAVSGGFLYISDKNLQQFDLTQLDTKKSDLSRWQVKKNLLYPLITDYFRTQYPSVLSKLILGVAKKVGIVTTPLAAPSTAHNLPREHALLATHHVDNLKQQLEQRRKLALEYFKAFEKLSSISLPITLEQIEEGSNLRFPLLVKAPDTIIKKLAEKDIYLSDRWYRSPVDCSTLTCNTVYQAGSCPNAEELSKHCLNLPTHQYVTSEYIKIMVRVIQEMS